MTKITATQAASVFPTYSPEDVRKALLNHDEVALIDVREEDPFAQEHPLWAANFPLSKLEIEAWARIPRRDTLIVVYGEYAGTDLAPRAAAVLRELGYTRVHLLEGGLRAWIDGGGEVFRDVNVPSKSFGEVVEARRHTPSLAAEEVQALIDTKADVVIVDARRFDEYQTMSIPTATSVPGAELVLRVRELAPDPNTRVIVNCAGRTRSIIGAQSLINARVPNRVMALKDGTMGWRLAGFDLETGKTRHAPAPGTAARARAQAAAHQVAARAGVRMIDGAELARLAAERERSLYLLDVRTPEEYAAGHPPGARSAPGGQLVQSTDAYVGTRNARLVLVDDDGVRARMTASWLVQMGWPEVYVLDGMRQGPALETGPERAETLGLDAADAATITVAELKAALDSEAVAVVDLDTSLRYRDGHIPGAWWAVRSRLAAALPRLPGGKPLVFTSPDGALARLAASEAGALTDVPVKALQGGTRAWQEAGHPLEQGGAHLADEPNDVWYKPYDHGTAVEGAMRAYLTWEVGLVPQIERDGDAHFRILAPVEP